MDEFRSKPEPPRPILPQPNPQFRPPTSHTQKEDLVVLLGEISPLPVTYAGGARRIEDLERVTELGKGKVRTGEGRRADGLVFWLTNRLCVRSEVALTVIPTQTQPDARGGGGGRWT